MPRRYACVLEDLKAIEELIAYGADPGARTRIDEYATPLEEAEILGRKRAAALLREIAARAKHNRDA